MVPHSRYNDDEDSLFCIVIENKMFFFSTFFHECQGRLSEALVIEQHKKKRLCMVTKWFLTVIIFFKGMVMMLCHDLRFFHS